MHSLLSVLFLPSSKKPQTKPTKTHDFGLNKLMKAYPKCRNWNGLIAREAKGEKLCSIKACFQAATPLLVTLSC